MASHTVWFGELATLLRIFGGAQKVDGFTPDELNKIRVYQDLAIIDFRLTVLFESSYHRVGTRQGQYSDNHAVFYLITDKGSIRFSMENEDNIATTQGKPGALEVRIQDFTDPSNRSLINLQSPWTRTQTVKQFITLMDSLKMHHFIMHKNLEGCRHWW